MSFPEVQRLLRLMNVEMDQEHAFQLFQVSLPEKDLQKPATAMFLARGTLTPSSNTHLSSPSCVPIITPGSMASGSDKVLTLQSCWKDDS